MVTQEREMAAAEGDLQDKAVPRNPLHYGDLDFILAFAATAGCVQFFTIDMAGQVRPSVRDAQTSGILPWHV